MYGMMFSTLYGLLRPPRESRINIYRAATDALWAFPPMLELHGEPLTFPVSLVHEIATTYHNMQSTNQKLWLPTYCVLCLDTIGSNGHCVKVSPRYLLEPLLNFLGSKHRSKCKRETKATTKQVPKTRQSTKRITWYLFATHDTQRDMYMSYIFLLLFELLL